jgi:hypothetical protein
MIRIIFSTIRPSEHIQTFTFKKMTELLKETGFKILSVKHSDFLSFLPIFNQFDKLCYVDCKLADSLPHFFVSGFYFACQKIINLD